MSVPMQTEATFILAIVSLLAGPENAPDRARISRRSRRSP
jgi:hypothetical protein